MSIALCLCRVGSELAGDAPPTWRRGPRRVPIAMLAVLAWALVAPARVLSEGPAAAARLDAQASAGLRAREARGWLELEQDQMSARVPSQAGRLADRPPLAPRPRPIDPPRIDFGPQRAEPPDTQSDAAGWGQIRDRQERARLAETLQRQRQEIDALRRTQRRGADSGAAAPAAAARVQGLMMRQDRDLEALRLQRGLGR